jgi:putative peptide zinc metalloprotease protein
VSARTVWPASAGPLPTAEHPALAVVLTPRTGDGPTWVFPFDRPAPPGPGDNQALAVVTKDGATVYDVAFALVWADSDTVLNRNEAYAFASCRDCRAVAVSFQVVLVVGHASIAAPQNVSAAVAYGCVRCVTEALAVQLVVSVPGGLSDDAMRQLMLLWQRIRAFGQHLRGLTFAQIQARIAAYQRQILAIVRPDLTTVPSPTATPTPTPSGSPSATMGSSTSPPVGSSSPSGSPTGTSSTPTSSDGATATPTGSGAPASTTPPATATAAPTQSP